MTPSPAALALTDRIIDMWNSTQPESVRVPIAAVLEEVLDGGRNRELVLRKVIKDALRITSTTHAPDWWKQEAREALAATEYPQ